VPHELVPLSTDAERGDRDKYDYRHAANIRREFPRVHACSFGWDYTLRFMVMLK
jgi:hypothetical protein